MTTRARATRDRILDAAAEVMRTVGLAGATTKEIARVAGYSEAALYKHFADKDDLFFHVLAERLPTFAGALGKLVEPGRERPLEARLADVALAALRFYAESMPIAVSILADPEALARHRKRMQGLGRGPERANAAVAAFLRAEQEAGRIADGIDLQAAATLLIGACFQRVFLATYHGEALDAATSRRAAAAIAKTLVRGLAR